LNGQFKEAAKLLHERGETQDAKMLLMLSTEQGYFSDPVKDNKQVRAPQG
jgi:hypothetical protein